MIILYPRLKNLTIKLLGQSSSRMTINSVFIENMLYIYVNFFIRNWNDHCFVVEL